MLPLRGNRLELAEGRVGVLAVSSLLVPQADPGPGVDEDPFRLAEWLAGYLVDPARSMVPLDSVTSFANTRYCPVTPRERGVLRCELDSAQFDRAHIPRQSVESREGDEYRPIVGDAYLVRANRVDHAIEDGTVAYP